MADFDAAENMVAQAVEKFGRIDGVVNNAPGGTQTELCLTDRGLRITRAGAATWMTGRPVSG